LCWIEVVPFDESVQHLPGELVATELRERTVPPADRRPDRVDDERVRHVLILGRAAPPRARARSAAARATEAAARIRSRRTASMCTRRRRRRRRARRRYRRARTGGRARD